MCKDDEKLKHCGCGHHCEHENNSQGGNNDCGCGHEDCHCGNDCHCNEDENCGCCQGKKCDCDDDCHCGNDCHCDDDCKCGGKHDGDCHCGDDCDCGDDCKCGDEHMCNDECDCKNADDEYECKGHADEKAIEYLNLARQIQADFENFRRHALEDVRAARLAGQASVIEAFLPCLDTFKEGKKSITDETVLKGVEMIENSVNEALRNLGVEKIDSIGKVYNPHLHNVIAVVNNPDQDDDIIVDEYQAGYKFNDKILRYAKVIVNKKEGN